MENLIERFRTAVQRLYNPMDFESIFEDGMNIFNKLSPSNKQDFVAAHENLVKLYPDTEIPENDPNDILIIMLVELAAQYPDCMIFGVNHIWEKKMMDGKFYIFKDTEIVASCEFNNNNFVWNYIDDQNDFIIDIFENHHK